MVKNYSDYERGNPLLQHGTMEKSTWTFVDLHVKKISFIDSLDLCGGFSSLHTRLDSTLHLFYHS